MFLKYIPLKRLTMCTNKDIIIIIIRCEVFLEFFCEYIILSFVIMQCAIILSYNILHV